MIEDLSELVKVLEVLHEKVGKEAGCEIYSDSEVHLRSGDDRQNVFQLTYLMVDEHGAGAICEDEKVTSYEDAE